MGLILPAIWRDQSEEHLHELRGQDELQRKQVGPSNLLELYNLPQNNINELAIHVQIGKLCMYA